MHSCTQWTIQRFFKWALCFAYCHLYYLCSFQLSIYWEPSCSKYCARGDNIKYTYISGSVSIILLFLSALIESRTVLIEWWKWKSSCEGKNDWEWGRGSVSWKIFYQWEGLGSLLETDIELNCRKVTWILVGRYLRNMVTHGVREFLRIL